MVYNEYFVRGTEPRTFCPIHDAYEDRSFWRIFTGGRDERPHVPARDVVVERRPDDRRADERRSEVRPAPAEVSQPAGVTGGVLTQPEPQASTAQEPKRRGFWGRISAAAATMHQSPSPNRLPARSLRHAPVSHTATTRLDT